MPSPSALGIRPKKSAVLLLLLFAISACSQSAPQPKSSASAQPTEKLSRFYNQKLAFGPCKGFGTSPSEDKLYADPRLECTRLKVPLDYDAPDGRTGQVAVLRVPAREKSAGSLLLNPGGPGGPGLPFAAATGKALAKSPLTARFDLVGLDPRGVGATRPAITCFTNEDYRNGDVQTEFITSAGKFSADDTRQLVEKCEQRSGGKENLAAVGTRDTVRDLDVLRAALGEKKVTSLGQSYGTRIGALYAQAFPDRVRVMVLDGAVDPHLGSERRLSQYAGLQRSFDQMAADCATRPKCPLGQEPERATENFQKIARQLLDKPVPYGDGQKFTYDDLVGSAIVALYYQQTWPALTKGLTELQAGDPSRLVKLSAVFGGRNPDGSGSNFTDANFGIGCMDEERKNPQQAGEFRQKLYDKAPFADPGGSREGARDTCEAWPAPPEVTYPFPSRVDGLPPILTVSITGDPSTSYHAGVTLSKALGGSLLTVKGEQHTIAASGTNPCVNKIVADYLINLKTPPPAARCEV
ncbi:alpha/beta hydrolase [Streptomyces acidicola]|uniref:alpha/beta hydrolase n=1 Tax=Streptomyces acidicola TaxID=2596892 RepID=UPI003433BD8F